MCIQRFEYNTEYKTKFEPVSLQIQFNLNFQTKV